jgi:hypothetical protein
VEDLNIDKSISLINMNNNEKFTVTGDVSSNVYTGELSIVISGINMFGTIDLSHNLKVLNSTIRTILSAKSITLVNSQISTFRLVKGTAKLYGNIITNYASFDNSINSPSKIDTTVIVGNVFNYTVEFNLKNSKIYIHNNMFFQNTLRLMESTMSCIKLEEGDYEIYNNTFYNKAAISISHPFIIFGLQGGGKIIRIHDNVFWGDAAKNPTHLIMSEESGQHNVTLIFKNNYYDVVTPNFKKYTGAFTDFEDNFRGANIQIDINTFITTGDNINAGDPDPLMSDLDLTRNDAGCHGGPNSISNYFPQDDNGARVYKIEMPRRFFTGSNVNIKAFGVDK